MTHPLFRQPALSTVFLLSILFHSEHHLLACPSAIIRPVKTCPAWVHNKRPNSSSLVTRLITSETRDFGTSAFPRSSFEWSPSSSAVLRGSLCYLRSDWVYWLAIRLNTKCVEESETMASIGWDQRHWRYSCLGLNYSKRVQKPKFQILTTLVKCHI